MKRVVFKSRPRGLIQFVLTVFLFFVTLSGIAQDLEFVDLGVVEGEFKRYDRTLTWTNPSSDSVQLILWSSDADLKFTPLKSPVAGGAEVEIPISITLPSLAGDKAYELRLLDEDNLLLHGFQMSFKVLQGELDVFKAYRNVHFPFRTKEEVFNLKAGQRGDTLTAMFDVYNLGGKDLDMSRVRAGDSIQVSFSSGKVPHHTFSQMRIKLITNENSMIGFQKHAIKLYDEERLIGVLPIQYTLIPKVTEEGPSPKLTSSIVNHDFKVMKVGDKKEAVISLANNGSAPLIIEKIESNCACLTFNNLEQISAGSSQSLRVEFNATNRIGLERKTIAIFTNDPARPVLVLAFRAHVK